MNNTISAKVCISTVTHAYSATTPHKYQFYHSHPRKQQCLQDSHVTLKQRYWNSTIKWHPIHYWILQQNYYYWLTLLHPDKIWNMWLSPCEIYLTQYDTYDRIQKSQDVPTETTLYTIVFVYHKKKPESTRKQKYKTSGATKFKMIKRSNSDTNQEK